MSHTKEPWDTDGFSSVGATGSDQFNGGYFTANCEGPDKQENARRIVACVNACKGIPNEVLQTVGAFGGFGRDQMVEHVTKQRDELLAALARTRNMIRSNPDAAENCANDAIASVKGTA